MGEWDYICGEYNWNASAAEVACKELGYDYVTGWSTHAYIKDYASAFICGDCGKYSSASKLTDCLWGVSVENSGIDFIDAHYVGQYCALMGSYSCPTERF